MWPYERRQKDDQFWFASDPNCNPRDTPIINPCNVLIRELYQFTNNAPFDILNEDPGRKPGVFTSIMPAIYPTK